MMGTWYKCIVSDDYFTITQVLGDLGANLVWNILSTSYPIFCFNSRPILPFWVQFRPLISYVLHLVIGGCSAILELKYLALIWWCKGLFICIWIFFNGIIKKTITFDCIVQDLKWCGKAVRNKNPKLSLWSIIAISIDTTLCDCSIYLCQSSASVRYSLVPTYIPPPTLPPPLPDFTSLDVRRMAHCNVLQVNLEICHNCAAFSFRICSQ